ncbi:hypothetical protein Gotri_004561 [Gossypium trilobum]|uniref:RNase H type-1 domain-containing protein n=1 Tax=Gossypium trilobum TaxID=34281 RepID=A0A7J9F590_9ROSI|nr:hypothetical protein [Gossypium trilobum]
MKDDLPDCIAWDKSSFLWKSLLKIRSLPRENLFWSVGDGNKIRCWKDNWIPSIWPPVRHIRANANLDLNCFLNEMITDKGSDKISRSHTSSGAFSVKTTYKDNSKIHEGGASWACLFGLLIWRLWNNRNLFNFQGRSWSSREIVQVSYSWAIHFFSSSREVPIDCLEHSFEAQTSRERIFLNTDGAVQLDSGYVTVEGVVCERNQVADCLAKQALIGKDELQEFEDPPMVVRTSYEMDKSKGDLSF